MRTGRRWVRGAVVAGGVAAVGVCVVSCFVPVGSRAGVILDAPVGAAWRVGLTRGALTYRREAPAPMGGQHLAWTPTLLGEDPFGPWHRGVSWWRLSWDARDLPAKVAELHVPVWPLAVAWGGVAGWIVRRGALARRRRTRGECEACGFPLNAQGGCTECGVRGGAGQGGLRRNRRRNR